MNLLFSEATEGPVNTVTPAWVTAPVSQGGAGVPTVSCAGQPTMPVYFNATYEAAWEAFIAAAVHQFSFANSPLAASVGYMRFATAGGAEALPPPGYNDGGPCQALWTAAGYSYDAWNAHEANIINAMGSQPTDKQIMVSLPYVSGGPNVYAVANLGAAAAAAKHVGFSFENLGVSNVAAPGVDARAVQSAGADRQPALVPGVHELRGSGAAGAAADHGDDQHVRGDDGHRASCCNTRSPTGSRSSSSIRRNGCRPIRRPRPDSCPPIRRRTGRHCRRRRWCWGRRTDTEVRDG